MKKLRVGVLVSGRGSNMESVLRATKQGILRNVVVACVVSDNPSAEALLRARQWGVPAHYLPPGGSRFSLKEKPEANYIALLRSYEVDLVCLAGFMRILQPKFIASFGGKVINIHPSLLPKHPGLDAQRKALDAGDQETGCTVHWVDAGIDTGKIIKRKVVPIQKGDTAESLSARILEQEHKLLVQVLETLSANWSG